MHCKRDEYNRRYPIKNVNWKFWIRNQKLLTVKTEIENDSIKNKEKPRMVLRTKGTNLRIIKVDINLHYIKLWQVIQDS